MTEALELSRLRRPLPYQREPKKLRLPPYWDGVYSKTWRYMHPVFKVSNEKEYVSGTPKAYHHSLAQ